MRQVISISHYRMCLYFRNVKIYLHILSSNNNLIFVYSSSLDFYQIFTVLHQLNRYEYLDRKSILSVYTNCAN